MRSQVRSLAPAPPRRARRTGVARAANQTFLPHLSSVHFGKSGKILHRGTLEVPGPNVACSPAYHLNSAATRLALAAPPGPVRHRSNSCPTQPYELSRPQIRDPGTPAERNEACRASIGDMHSKTEGILESSLSRWFTNADLLAGF